MRRDALRDQIDRELINLLAGKDHYDPNQLRDPHSGEWIDSGQIDELIKTWTSPGGYSGIQKALRTPPSDAELAQSPYLMKMKKTAQRLEAVIAAKGESRQGEEAWRLTSTAHIDPATLARLRAGDEVEFRDPGFLSLTPDRQTAENIGAFTHVDEEQMLLHVNIESTTKALEPDRGEFGKVREWVFPSGTGMRVVMTGRTSHGIPIYEVIL